MNTYEDKLEHEIEDIIPKKSVKEVKRRPLLYLTGFVLACLLLIGLSSMLVVNANQLQQQKAQVSSLNANLQKKADELSILQNDLNQTQAGQKELESAKAQADANAATAQADANSNAAAKAKAKADANAAAAQQQATKAQNGLQSAQAQLNSANAQLTSVQSQLNSTNTQLNNANTQLASAKTCVSLFGTVTSQITNYDTDMSNALYYETSSANAGLAGNYSLALADLNISETDYNLAEAIFPGIKSILDKVGSGSCS